MRGHRGKLALAAAAALVAGVVAAAGGLPSIDLEKLLEDLARELGEWTYLLVGVMAFLETGAFVGLVAPGEFSVILGGAIAGQGEISVWVLLAVVWFSAWAGDSVSFLLGRRLGRGFILAHGHRVRITQERFAQVERYFARHGGKTIFVGRFIGLVRALAPFIAGSSGMRYRSFVPYSILGTGLWGTGFTLLGFFAARSLDTATRWAGRGSVLFGIVVGVAVAAVLAVRYLKVPEHRRRLVEAMDSRWALRWMPAACRAIQSAFGPQLRFLWQRLTPGGLGLELTTLVAVIAVGAYTFVAYAVVVSNAPFATRADRTALDVVAELRNAPLTDVARTVTRLGDAGVVYGLVGAFAVWLGSRRRWLELAVLLPGLLVITIGQAELKELIERPRPYAGEVDVDSFSFPSGHAAHSTFYVWLAVTASRVVPLVAARFGLVFVGLGVCAAVGLSRVYLRVHFLSDVIGGWALGASVLATVAVLALVISHLRNNARSDAPSEGRA